MNKNISAVFTGYESKTLGLIKPLYGSLLPLCCTSLLKNFRNFTCYSGTEFLKGQSLFLAFWFFLRLYFRLILCFHFPFIKPLYNRTRKIKLFLGRELPRFSNISAISFLIPDSINNVAHVFKNCICKPIFFFLQFCPCFSHKLLNIPLKLHHLLLFRLLLPRQKNGRLLGNLFFNFFKGIDLLFYYRLFDFSIASMSALAFLPESDSANMRSRLTNPILNASAAPAGAT